MFERFTDRAREAVHHAQDEAVRAGADTLGTEHLLLGLVGDRSSIAGRVLAAAGVEADALRAAITARAPAPGDPPVGDAEALASIGIDLEQVTAAVEESFGPGALRRGRGRRRRGDGRRAPLFAAEAKKVLELSLREALSMKHSYIGTEHFLLALLRLPESVAYEVLDGVAPPATALRAKVLDEMARIGTGSTD